MSNSWITWAFQQEYLPGADKKQKNKVPSGAKFVLMVLADHADEKGICWPSQKRMSEYTNMTLRSIGRHCDWLEEHGYIKRQRTKDEKGKWERYEYVLETPHDNLSKGQKSETPHDNLTETHTTDCRTNPYTKTPNEPPLLKFDDFWKEWITEDNANDLCKSDEARIIWEADLSEDEKADAITGIPGFQRFYRIKTPDKKFKMLGAKRYLSEIKHKDFCQKPNRSAISGIPEIDLECPYFTLRRKLALDRRIGVAGYNTWLKDMRISEEDGKFRLYWPTQYLRDHCNQHFRASFDGVFGESHRCKVEPPP